MINSAVFSIVTFVYFLAFFFFLLGSVRPGGTFNFHKMAVWSARGGLLLHTIGLGIRWFESYEMGIGRIPLANFYESLIFFAWSIILLFLIVEHRLRSKSAGLFVLPFAFIAMAYGSFSPDVDSRITPLIPALQSNWLSIHVITCFLGYAGFTLACGLGIMYLIKSRAERRGNQGTGFHALLPSLADIDESLYQSALVGFVFLTLGIMTGSIWAYSAWGAYWSWDPKETWSLITWLVYAIMIHVRYMRGWRGRRMAFLSLIGFAAVLFTYFGVNYLPGLHSYL